MRWKATRCESDHRKSVRVWTRRIAIGLTAATAGLVVFARIEAARIAAAYPPTGRFMAIDGGRLHYTERAPIGQNRGTMLLLHGASGNQADVMLALGDRLAAQGYRVIAPDRPGHGWSDRPDGEADASPARQAALLRQGLHAIGVDHAVVLGHSWSGALAIAFALDQPDFTDGLVLVAPVTRPWSTGVAWYYTFAGSPGVGPLFNALLTMPVGLLAMEAGLKSVFLPQKPPPDYAARTGLALLLRPGEFTANAQDVGHLSRFLETQAPRMGSITAPTAIVTGDRDGIVWTALHSEGAARLIPGATLTVLPGVGHSPHWSVPDAVVAAALSVADRAKSRAAGHQT